jgi:putative molybdopterin biosynthesis protein
MLLDHELRRLEIDPTQVSGYAREEPTHLAVAAAISAGRADCGLGIMAAARAFDLDFIPVSREPYDLVVEASSLEDPLLAPLWKLLDSPDFHASIEALGGYSTEATGRRIR